MAIETKTPFCSEQAQGAGPAFLLDSRFCAGNVFFVHSGRGSNSTGRGRTPSQPVASIAYCFSGSLVTADQGDLIVVLPGHTETITGAAGVAANIAGVTILGVGAGRQRPIVNYTTAAAASFDVSAARITVDNLVFTMTGVDAITAGINVSGADFTLRNCEVEFATASAQATLCLLTASGANRMTVENCYFHGTSDAGTAAAIRVAAGSDVRILNNIFFGSFTTSLGAIDNSAAVVNLQIHDNVIDNVTASSTKAIVCHASSTGQISRNRMQILSGTAPITGAAMSWVGQNYYAATVATAGTLI